MLPRRVRWASGTILFPLSMLLALAVAAPVAAGNPPGNNGTVKIDGWDWDSHPDNEPHVGCEFEVDFYGFDFGDGIEAEVTFEAHPPTGQGLVLNEEHIWIGHDDAGGGTDLDASRRFDLKDALSAYPVHPQQGYHVKLTVNADGSQGADTKHKVFWVGPCDSGDPGDPPPTPLTPLTPLIPPSNPPSNPPSTPPGGGNQGGDPPRGGVAAGSGGPAVVTLPDTAMSAASTSGLLMAGVVLLGGGATLVAVTVRRTAHAATD